jgi:hypothetical protein
VVHGLIAVLPPLIVTDEIALGQHRRRWGSIDDALGREGEREEEAGQGGLIGGAESRGGEAGGGGTLGSGFGAGLRARPSAQVVGGAREGWRATAEVWRRRAPAPSPPASRH